METLFDMKPTDEELRELESMRDLPDRYMDGPLLECDEHLLLTFRFAVVLARALRNTESEGLTELERESAAELSDLIAHHATSIQRAYRLRDMRLRAKRAERTDPRIWPQD